jgi:hypothetical protein
MFCDYFFTQLYRPSYVKQTLDRLKIQTIQQKNNTTIFHLYSKAAGHSVVCEIIKKIEELDVAPSTSYYRLCRQKMFHVRRQNRVVAQLPRLYRCFNHGF